jgi:hypothetical protein
MMTSPNDTSGHPLRNAWLIGACRNRNVITARFLLLSLRFRQPATTNTFFWPVKMDAEKMALSSSANSQRKTDRKVRFSFVFTRSYATRNRTEVHGFAGRFAEGF